MGINVKSEEERWMVIESQYLKGYNFLKEKEKIFPGTGGVCFMLCLYEYKNPTKIKSGSLIIIQDKKNDLMLKRYVKEDREFLQDFNLDKDSTLCPPVDVSEIKIIGIVMDIVYHSDIINCD